MGTHGEWHESGERPTARPGFGFFCPELGTSQHLRSKGVRRGSLSDSQEKPQSSPQAAPRRQGGGQGRMCPPLRSSVPGLSPTPPAAPLASEEHGGREACWVQGAWGAPTLRRLPPGWARDLDLGPVETLQIRLGYSLPPPQHTHSHVTLSCPLQGSGAHLRQECGRPCLSHSPFSPTLWFNFKINRSH